MLASSGSNIKFWDLKTFSLIQEITTNLENVERLSWNKEGNYLSSLALNSSEISLYRISCNSGACSNIIRAIDHPKDFQFAKTNSRYLAIAGAKDTVLVWDIKNNNKKKFFNVRGGDILKLSFNSTDSHLTVGTKEGSAYVLSNSNNLISGPIELFSVKSPVTDLQYSHSSNFLVGACSEFGSVSFLDVKTEKVFKEMKNSHCAPISGLCFSPINELLMVTVGYDKKFNSYNVNTKREIMSHLSSSPLTSVSFIGNGQHVALGTMLGEILIHDLRSLKIPITTISAHKGKVFSIKLQPNSSCFEPVQKTSRKSNKNVQNNEIPSSCERVNLANLSDRPEENKRSNESICISPTLQILSPVHSNEKNYKQENDQLMITPPRSKKSPSKKIDDLGILSPIDKENKIPSYNDRGISLENGNKDTEALLQTSPKHNRQSSQLNRGKSPIKKSLIEDLGVQLISPIKKSRVKTNFQLDFEQLPKLNNIKELDNIKISSFVNGIEEDQRNNKHLDSATSSLNCKEISATSSLNINDINSKINHRRGSKEEDCMTNIQIDTNLLLEKEELNQFDKYQQNNQTSSHTSKFTTQMEDDSVFECDKLLLNGSKNKERASCSDSTFSNDINLLPNSTKMLHNHDNMLPNHDSMLPNDTNVLTKDISSVNLKLIQNCVLDAFENYQFDVNKRFMHMHYLMAKHFLRLKKEMREMLRETSLNEELLLENERLREELKRLKATY